MAKKKKTEEQKLEKKEHEKMHEVYKAGDRYHCGECGAELDFGKDCPVCKNSFNWKKITNGILYR